MPQPLGTRTQTVGKFQTDGIPWSELLKTFQEVMVFTRKLGIRYLWIDSPAAKRASTENRSKIGILAWATLCEDVPTMFSFEHGYSRNPTFLDRVAPLLRRAWVLQERLISRRLLHFTPI